MKFEKNALTNSRITHEEWLGKKCFDYDMRGSKFDNVTFSDIVFKYCLLKRCIFNKCIFKHVDLDENNMSFSDFSYCELDNVKFESNLNYIKLSNTVIYNSDLIDRKITGAWIDKTVFKHITLKNVVLENTEFENTTFYGCKFCGVNLIDVQFDNVEFIDCMFSELDLMSICRYKVGIYNCFVGGYGILKMQCEESILDEISPTSKKLMEKGNLVNSTINNLWNNTKHVSLKFLKFAIEYNLNISGMHLADKSIDSCFLDDIREQCIRIDGCVLTNCFKKKINEKLLTKLIYSGVKLKLRDFLKEINDEKWKEFLKLNNVDLTEITVCGATISIDELRNVFEMKAGLNKCTIVAGCGNGIFQIVYPGWENVIIKGNVMKSQAITLTGYSRNMLQGICLLETDLKLSEIEYFSNCGIILPNIRLNKKKIPCQQLLSWKNAVPNMKEMFVVGKIYSAANLHFFVCHDAKFKLAEIDAEELHIYLNEHPEANVTGITLVGAIQSYDVIRNFIRHKANVSKLNVNLFIDDYKKLRLLLLHNVDKRDLKISCDMFKQCTDEKIDVTEIAIVGTLSEKNMFNYLMYNNANISMLNLNNLHISYDDMNKIISCGGNLSGTILEEKTFNFAEVKKALDNEVHIEVDKFTTISCPIANVSQITPRLLGKLIKLCVSYKPIEELKDIFECVKKRKIKYLLHFTRCENLKSIFTYGLLSRNYLENNSLEVIVTDDDRFEKMTDYICLSISFPNYKMFWRKRLDYPKAEWAVLLINAEILAKCSCKFFKINAASRGAEEVLLSELFEDDGTRVARQLYDNEPTNSQSEVLVKDWIKPEHIIKVFFKDQETFDKYASDIPLNKGCLNTKISLFEPRHDWWYEKMNNL